MGKIKKLVCYIQMGALEHTVFIIEENNKIKDSFKLTLTEIPNFIAQQQDIQNVYLTGINQNFLKKIEEEVKKIEYKLYAQNNKIFHYKEIQ